MLPKGVSLGLMIRARLIRSLSDRITVIITKMRRNRGYPSWTRRWRGSNWRLQSDQIRRTKRARITNRGRGRTRDMSRCRIFKRGRFHGRSRRHDLWSRNYVRVIGEQRNSRIKKVGFGRDRQVELGQREKHFMFPKNNVLGDSKTFRDRVPTPITLVFKAVP